MIQEDGFKENPLAPIVIKLSNIVVLLIAFIVALLVLLAIYIPAPEPSKQVETPVADKNGLFTDAARTESSNQKDKHVFGPQIRSRKAGVPSCAETSSRRALRP